MRAVTLGGAVRLPHSSLKSGYAGQPEDATLLLLLLPEGCMDGEMFGAGRAEQQDNFRSLVPQHLIHWS